MTELIDRHQLRVKLEQEERALTSDPRAATVKPLTTIFFDTIYRVLNSMKSVRSDLPDNLRGVLSEVLDEVNRQDEEEPLDEDDMNHGNTRDELVMFTAQNIRILHAMEPPED